MVFMQFLVNKATCLGNPDNHDENDDKKNFKVMLLKAAVGVL